MPKPFQKDMRATRCSSRVNEPATLDEAVQLARSVEAIAVPLGYHVALAGSCLYAGRSEKDIDLIIYAHDPKEGTHHKQSFLDAFEAIGGHDFFQTHEKYVNRDVVLTQIGGKRVDLFFI